MHLPPNNVPRFNLFLQSYGILYSPLSRLEFEKFHDMQAKLTAEWIVAHRERLISEGREIHTGDKLSEGWEFPGIDDLLDEWSRLGPSTPSLVCMDGQAGLTLARHSQVVTKTAK